ncbi:HNH endonuclease [Spirosoma gilvum]
MEKRVTSLVFRRVTYADFRHINKVGGEEVGGGGQSYIDFPVQNISLQMWFDFLGTNTGNAVQGPFWQFSINSFGLNTNQTLKIYQRRPASVSIASQKIHSKRANRINAWHPDNGFPEDYDPAAEHLIVYIVKTNDDQFWAGWFLKNDIPKEWSIDDNLRQLFTQNSAGYIQFTNKTFVETTNAEWPFYFTPKLSENQLLTDEDVQEELTEEDTSVKLRNLGDVSPQVKERLTKFRTRNLKLVKDLKTLYGGKCQLTNDEYTFLKKDGSLYSEVHHLIPLGEAGSDNYANAIVVSPLIHRMLHYAEVSPIDLAQIQDGKLTIQINGKDYTITWHPNHLETVTESLND